MGDHLIDGEFQSDKYPTCPRGKVPLSVKDTRVQDLLWEVAFIWDSVDTGFASDLRAALRNAGYEPPRTTRTWIHKDPDTGNLSPRIVSTNRGECDE